MDPFASARQGGEEDVLRQMPAKTANDGGTGLPIRLDHLAPQGALSRSGFNLELKKTTAEHSDYTGVK